MECWFTANTSRFVSSDSVHSSQRVRFPPMINGERKIDQSVICVRCSSRVRRVARLTRSEEHTSELQSHLNLVCRLLLEKKKKILGHTRTSLLGSCTLTL